MNIKRNCIFLLDKEKEKPDSKLRYRIKWDGNTVAFNVGYRVDNNKWVAEAQRCKPNTTHGKKKISAATINSEINRFEETVNNVFYSFEMADKSPSVNEFRIEFNKQIGKEEKKSTEKDLFYYLNRFIIEHPSEVMLAEHTVESYLSLKKNLKDFAPDLQFSDLTQDTISRFITYLIELGRKNRTIRRIFVTLKTFLSWCTDKGYNTNTDFRKYKLHLKIVPRTVVFLSWDELMKVLNYTPSRQTLATVRDCFCFQCFTSLRFSDVKNLSWTDVHDDYISITTIKTSDSLRIELNDYSRMILERTPHVSSKVFNISSVSRFNTFLREIWKEAGIDAPVRMTSYTGAKRTDEVKKKYELASSHAGRRTFICNALSMGIAPNIIMKWTGHKDYDTMKPYIDITDKTKQDAMKLFNRNSPQ